MPNITNLIPMNENVLILDIKSKFACFRRIDTNSTSLSYKFPPRTTIIGMLSAILGRERDSYYDEFSKSEIAIRIKQGSRSIFQTVNNIKVKSQADLDLYRKGYDSPTQIPTELLVPISYKDHLTFRIYFTHSDNELYTELKKCLSNHTFSYPPSLGFANMLSSIEFVGEGKLKTFNSQSENSSCTVVTPVPLDEIASFDLGANNNENMVKLLKDIMPCSFDSDRNPTTKNYLYELSGNPISFICKDTEKVFTVRYVSDKKEIEENLFYL
jgi:CRISPR-associated protein Cas5h